MKVVYLETSSLLCVLFRQGSYEDIAELLELPETVVVTSVLTLMESRRAISRASADGMLKEGDANALLGVLAEQESNWQIIELTEAIQNRVGQRFPVEPVRTLDAVHLASALELRKIYPELTILSHDERVKANLQALGLG